MTLRCDSRTAAGERRALVVGNYCVDEGVLRM